MIRKKKLFSRPRKSYERARIDEENEIVKRFGLKNKREIWKTSAKLKYFRRRAKSLAKSSSEEQEVLFKKLNAIGLKVETIADVLALTIEDVLNRRLQTVVFKKGLANSPKHARQLVVHKKTLVNGALLNKPSYLVPTSYEDSIKVISPKPAPKKAAEETAEVTE